MILTVAPVSMAYTTYGASDEGDKFSYGSHTVENPTEIWVDTSETTGTVRVGAGQGTVERGQKLLQSTPSGITPASSYPNFAYSGESLQSPKLVLKVYGLTAANQQSLTFTTDPKPSNNVTGITFPAASREAFTDGQGSGYKFTWVMGIANAQLNNVASGQETNQVLEFEIAYKFGNTVYKTYAYSDVEYALNPNGVCNYSIHKYKSGLFGWGSSEGGRLSIVAMLQSAQMKSGYASTTVSNTRCYFDFNSGSADDGKALKGCGNDGGGQGGFLTQALGSGYYSVLYHNDGELDKVDEGSPKDAGLYSSVATDGNRVLSTVWLDKGYDHIGQGESGGKPNGINMRLTLKPGEIKGFYDMYVYSFKLYNGNNNNGGALSNANSAIDVGTQWTVTDKNKIADGGSSNGLTSIKNGGHNGTGTGTWLEDNDICPYENYPGNDYYINIHMAGTGPTTTQTTNANCWAFSYEINGLHTNDSSDMTGNIDTGNRTYKTICQSVRFRLYDTTPLRKLLQAVSSGDVTTFNNNRASYKSTYSTIYGGSTTLSDTALVFKGVNPQEANYSSGWANYLNAYKAAVRIIASFDVNNSAVDAGAGTEQNKINTAYNNLITAYNALGYTDSGYIDIAHVLSSDTGVSVAPTERIWGKDAQGNIVRTATSVTVAPSSVVTPIKNNASFTLKKLSSIEGYTAGVSTQSGHVTFTGGSVNLFDESNNLLGGPNGGVSNAPYYFKYDAAPQNLIIHPNNGYNDGGNYATTVLLDATPDFATYKAAIGGKTHYNYAGMYVNSDFTGTAINETTYTMPAADVELYMKWTPVPVQLQIHNNINANIQYTASQVPAEVQGNLADVTFTRPTPAVISGAEFVNFYTDSAFTTPVDWNLIAGYRTAAAVAEEGVIDTTYMEINDDSLNENDCYTVDIYAKYVDNSYKIFFEPNGGTMPAAGDYTPSAGTYDATEGMITYTAADVTNQTAFNYPVPTRTGYIFTGWATKGDKTETGCYPINDTYLSAPKSYNGAWTAPNSGVSADDFSAIENGTITMNGNVGFVCYATWTPKDIYLTYRLDIQANEAHPINSSDSASNPYFVGHAKADQPVNAADEVAFPNTPRKYGYTFAYWKYSNGRQFNMNGKYPTTDTTLTAAWNEAFDVAFGDLTSYIPKAGTYYITDNQHGTVQEQAVKGDVVTMRFTASGKFFAGSSSYIFAYDSDFFERVGSVDVFALNQNNSYISGINAQKYEYVTDTNNYYANVVSHTIPGTSTTVPNIGIMQISLDPDVMNGYYTTASLDTTEYLFEVQMKIKDTATGDGNFWLCTDQVRTPDNVMGDVFFAYNPQAVTIDSTLETERVGYDMPVVTTITLDPDVPEREETDITISLKDNTGTVPADTAFVDGTTADKQFTGPEGTVITVPYTYTIPGVYDEENPNQLKVFAGVPDAARTGYTLDGWFKVESGAYTTDEWTPGYYASTEQDGATYNAKWTAEPRTYSFYYDEECTNLRLAQQTQYDATSINTPITNLAGYDFKGWIPQGMAATDANIVDFTAADCPYLPVRNDTNFYAWFVPAKTTMTIQAMLVTVDNTDPENPVTTSTTITGLNLTETVQTNMISAGALNDYLRVGDKVIIYDDLDTNYTVPADVVAISASAIEAQFSTGTISNYEIKRSELPASLLTEGNVLTSTAANNVINVEYQGAMVTDTISFGYVTMRTTSYPVATTLTTTDANHVITTEAYDEDGDEEADFYVNIYQITGRYGEPYDISVADIEASIVLPVGHAFSSWSGSGMGTFTGRTHEASYETYNIAVHFLKADHITDARATVSKRITANFTKANFNTYSGSAGVTPAGYTYAGWQVAKKASGATTYEVDSTLNNNVYGSATVYLCDIPNIAQYIETQDDGTTVTYHLYFIPKNNPNNYNVIYNTTLEGVASDDATIGQTVAFDSDYNLSTHTNQPGYDFNGWYTASDFSGTAIAEGSQATMTTEGITYYGYYTPKNYTVTFNGNGGTWGSDATQTATVTYNTSITAPATNPTQPTYIFQGWATTANATEALDSLGTLNDAAYANYDNLTFYAVWKLDTHTVTFDYNGGAGTPATAEAVEGGQIQQPTITTDKTGHSFGGWYINDTLVTWPYTMGNADVTMTAQWNPIPYTVTFNTDGGTPAVEPQTVNYNSTATEPSAPTREGYVFSGWKANGAGDIVTWPYTVTDDVQMVAQWTKEKYRITFNLNGGTLNGNPVNPVMNNVEYGSTIALYTAADGLAYEGHTFQGWKQGDTTVDWTTVPDLGADGASVTLTAQWTIDQHTVTYDANGGAPTPAPETVDYGSNATKPSDPSYEGYNFDGWYINDTLVTWPYTVTADVTMVAHWDRIYTATFNADGGTPVPSNVSGVAGTSVSKPADPAKNGFEFKGWQINGADVTWPYTINATDGDVTIVAVWEQLYTVTFDYNGGTGTPASVENLHIGDTVSKPADPTYAGYRFMGWKIGSDDVVWTNDDLYTVSGDVTMVAQWSELFTVTFNTDGGTPVPADVEGIAGDTVSIPATNPVKDGYNFSKWQINGTDVTWPYTITGDAEITAVYTPYTYTLKYNWNNANATVEQGVSDTTTVHYGENYVFIPVAGTDFYTTGYEFDGWYAEAACTNEVTADTPLPLQADGSIVNVYAKWVQGVYSVTFNLEGGSFPVSVDTDAYTGLHFLDPVYKPAAPEKTGYDFAGWTYTESGAVFNEWDNPNNMFQMHANSFALTANWTPHAYDVTYVQPDDMRQDATDITFINIDVYQGYATGTTVSLGSTVSGYPTAGPNPNADHFEFIGWSLTANPTPADAVAMDEWTLTAADIPATGNTIYFYPIITRIEVSIETANVDYVVDTEGNDAPPITGFIYNVGDRLTKAQVESIIGVDGDGTAVVYPSKFNKYCGSGTKIDIKDNVTDQVVETYYMVTFGDVDGSATCDSVDLGIVADEITITTPALKTWGLEDTRSELTEAELKSCECYDRAADVNADGSINQADVDIIRAYGLKGVTAYDLTDLVIQVEGQPLTVKRYEAEVTHA